MTVTAASGLATPVREAPWQNIVTTFDPGDKLADAIQKAGLDYEVGFAPMFYERPTDGQLWPVGNRRATVRKDTGQLLGFVGGRYTIVQNRDAFSFLEDVVDSGELKPVSAGQFRQGARPYLQARLPGDILVAGTDPITPFIFVGTSHDGGMPVTISLTGVRVICQNTYALAAKAERRFQVRHLASSEGRILAARQTLELSNRYFAEYGEAMNELAAQTITERDVKTVLERLFPMPKDAEEKEREKVALVRAQVYRNWLESPTLDGFRGTKYGLLNAVTEWSDHLKDAKRKVTQERTERKAESILLGDTVEWKDRVAALVNAV